MRIDQPKRYNRRKNFDSKVRVISTATKDKKEQYGVNLPEAVGKEFSGVCMKVTAGSGFITLGSVAPDNASGTRHSHKRYF